MNAGIPLDVSARTLAEDLAGDGRMYAAAVVRALSVLALTPDEASQILAVFGPAQEYLPALSSKLRAIAELNHIEGAR